MRPRDLSGVVAVDASSIEFRDEKAVVKEEPWKSVKLEEPAMGYTFPDRHG